MHSPATIRSSLTITSGCTLAAATLSSEHSKPLRATVAELAREYDARDRWRVRLEPEPPVIAEQLALAV
jgi:hypothetical protein